MESTGVIAGTESIPAYPVVRRIGTDDLKYALSNGFDDFMAMPTHVIFIGLIYPVAGIILARAAFGYDMLPLLYPLASGFALVGPLAAVGLYELSRRRELGIETSWNDGWDSIHPSTVKNILVLGVLLMLIFLAWLAVAQLLYWSLFGSETPASVGEFLSEVFTTSRGWALIVLGNLFGFAFAALVLSISVVSFPLLLDRHVGAVAAVRTSLRAVAGNPVTMAIWGLIVAAALVVGTIPLFVGLAIVMPVLGHATWHLYRRTVDASAFESTHPGQ